ncbi:MAG: YceI family protein [Sphingobacteriales bacterium]|nr:MAG: YceI family protein [Sphingobacteriales bacterium]
MNSLFPIAAASLLLFAACNNAPEAPKANATDAQAVTTPAAGKTYTVDVAQSSVGWIGTKPTGKHNGTFMIKDGNLMATDNAVTGGQFTIDMASIKALDQDAEGNTKLAGHLSSPDFFEVAKYPTSTFQITEVKPGIAGLTDVDSNLLKGATHTVTGNFTMKGVTKSITFPAKVTMNPTEVMADANFNIDRTQWGLIYGNDKGLGDKFINPMVNLNIHLVGKG